MTTTREIMTHDTSCAQVSDTLQQAAEKMRDLGVGALPICGVDDRLQGVLTDRDLVTRCVADGIDAATVRVEEMAGDPPATIDADAPVEQVLEAMRQHRVRRLPVLEDGRLVGMVSQADVARSLPPEQAGRLVEAISAAPANN